MVSLPFRRAVILRSILHPFILILVVGVSAATESLCTMLISRSSDAKPRQNLAASVTPAPHSLGLRMPHPSARRRLRPVPRNCPCVCHVCTSVSHAAKPLFCPSAEYLHLRCVCRARVHRPQRHRIRLRRGTPFQAASPDPALPDGSGMRHGSGGLGSAHGPEARRVSSHEDAGCGLMRSNLTKAPQPHALCGMSATQRHLTIRSCPAPRSP